MEGQTANHYIMHACVYALKKICSKRKQSKNSTTIRIYHKNNKDSHTPNHSQLTIMSSSWKVSYTSLCLEKVELPTVAYSTLWSAYGFPYATLGSVWGGLSSVRFSWLSPFFAVSNEVADWNSLVYERSRL